MILGLTIGALIYAACIAVYGTYITPDGDYYRAMGRGLHVPRPYSLRVLAEMMPTSMMAWRTLHMTTFGIAVVSVHAVAERVGASGWLAVAVVFTLPWLRQGIAWPALLDMPLFATACLTAALAPSLGEWVFVPIILSVLIHERAPLWCALYAWPWADVVIVVASVIAAASITAWQYQRCESHPDEERIDWLKDPITAARERHRYTWHDWRVWLMPWGGVALGFAQATAWVWAAVFVAYAGCLMAQDRARIYGMAALPLGLAACTIAGDYALLIPLVNWFITSKEV